MGKRYYCEYCNRAFLDNLTARKKHLASAAHHQQREAWYEKFKDKRQRLTEQLQKPRICRYYLQQGSCSFGPSCRYRHMTDEEVLKIQRDMEEEDVVKRQRTQAHECLPTVKSWLDKRQNAKHDSLPKHSSEEDLGMVSVPYVIPEVLLSLSSIPPSLLPPPHGNWIEYKDVDWG